MKKQYRFSCLVATTFSLFGAAGIEPDKIAKELFEEAKLAIATGRPGALDGLSYRLIHEHQEEVKQLLEYALRSEHNNNNLYVQQLIRMLQTEPKATSLSAGRVRSPSFRASETLTLMDIAIMKGNVRHVQELLKLKPDLSVCRLISDHKIMSIKEALALLIERMKNNETVYGGHKIDATLEQLQEIKILIDRCANEGTKRSFSLPAIFRKKK